MCLHAAHWRTQSIDIKPDSPFGIAQSGSLKKMEVHINLANLSVVKNFFSNLCQTGASF